MFEESFEEDLFRRRLLEFFFILLFCYDGVGFREYLIYLDLVRLFFVVYYVQRMIQYFLWRDSICQCFMCY